MYHCVNTNSVMRKEACLRICQEVSLDICVTDSRFATPSSKVRQCKTVTSTRQVIANTFDVVNMSGYKYISSLDLNTVVSNNATINPLHYTTLHYTTLHYTTQILTASHDSFQVTTEQMSTRPSCTSVLKYVRFGLFYSTKNND
jgi:hypothetical protein